MILIAGCYCVLICITAPITCSAIVNYQENAAHTQNKRTIAAVEKYYQDHQKYPEGLNELYAGSYLQPDDIQLRIVWNRTRSSMYMRDTQHGAILMTELSGGGLCPYYFDEKKWHPMPFGMP